MHDKYPSTTKAGVRVQYLGSETVVYPHYTDDATGAALVCSIGGVYNITPVQGADTAASDGRFAVLEESPREIEPPKESVPSQDTITPGEGE